MSAIDDATAVVFVHTASGATYKGILTYISSNIGVMDQTVAIPQAGVQVTSFEIQNSDGSRAFLPATSANYNVPPKEWHADSTTPPEMWGRDLTALISSTPITKTWTEIDPNFGGGEVEVTTKRADGVHHISAYAQNWDYNLVELTGLSESTTHGDSGSAMTYTGHNGVPQLIGAVSLAGLDGTTAAGPGLYGPNYGWLVSAIAAGHTPAIQRWEVVEQVDAFHREVGLPGLPAAEKPYWEGQADAGLSYHGVLQVASGVSSVKVAVSREMLGLPITWDKVAPMAVQLDQGTATLSSVESQLLSEYAALHGGVVPGNTELVRLLAHEITGQSLPQQDEVYYVDGFNVHGAPTMLAALATNPNVLGLLAPINAASDLYLG